MGRLRFLILMVGGLFVPAADRLGARDIDRAPHGRDTLPDHTPVRCELTR